jgi:hypothetical protein
MAPGGNKKLIFIVLAVVVVLGAGIGWFFLLKGGGGTNPSSPAFDRHGLPSTVPLPNNVTFKKEQQVTSQGFSADTWIWTVTGSDPATLQQFYTDNLPKNNWTMVNTNPQSDGSVSITACRTNTQLVGINVGTSVQAPNAQGTPTETITAPAGGATLAIFIASDQALVALACFSLTPTP